MEGVITLILNKEAGLTYYLHGLQGGPYRILMFPTYSPPPPHLHK